MPDERVDSRGSGWSPGYLDPLYPREDDDLYQCIEWAGTQPWSNGKVGMLGKDYEYAGELSEFAAGGGHESYLLLPIVPSPRS